MTYRRAERLVSQGDGELVTIVDAVAFFAGRADTLAGGDRAKSKAIREACKNLSGKVAILFFVTSLDTADAAPSDSRPNLGREFDQIPDLGRGEHEFSDDETKLILEALRYKMSRTPATEDEALAAAQAHIMIYEYERDN